MRILRRFPALAGQCAAIVVIACTAEVRETTDSVAGALGADSTLSLAEVAGTWNVRTTPEGPRGDAPTAFVLEARADTSGWTMTPAGGSSIPVRAWAQGDSVITEAVYESPPGVRVAAHTVFRLLGDSLVGVSTLRRSGAGADSVVRASTVGTRAR